MGLISLPPGVSPQDYDRWISETPEGRRYADKIASYAQNGMTVSHAPPMGAMPKLQKQSPPAPTQAPRPAPGLKMPAPSQGYNCEARVRQLEAELARLRGVGGGFEEAFQQSMSDNQNRIAEYRKGLAGAGPSGALGGLVG